MTEDDPTTTLELNDHGRIKPDAINRLNEMVEAADWWSFPPGLSRDEKRDYLAKLKAERTIQLKEGDFHPLVSGPSGNGSLFDFLRDEPEPQMITSEWIKDQNAKAVSGDFREEIRRQNEEVEQAMTPHRIITEWIDRNLDWYSGEGYEYASLILEELNRKGFDVVER